MRYQQNPLQIPELLGHTLGLVQLEKDLLACALVARSWVHPSQSRIFSTIEVPPRASHDLFESLLATLEGSQHHVGLISQLTIEHHGDRHSLRYLQRLANLRLARLTTLRICGNASLSHAPEAGVIGSLLQTPSLVSLSLEYPIDRLEHFREMWGGCSANIKHLKLDINAATRLGTPQPVRDLQAGSNSRRIQLESFAFSQSFAPTWLRDPECPFDIRSLKAFQVGFGTLDPLTDILSQSLETIEMLSLPLRVAVIMQLVSKVHISDFRGLRQLKLEHVCNPSWESLHAALKSIIPQEVRNRISSLSLKLLVGQLNDLKTVDSQFAPIHGCFQNLKVLHFNIQWMWPGIEPPPNMNLTTDAGLTASVNFGPGRDFDDFGELWYKRI